MLPVVAIVGRTNVGKSTLFNRLIGKRSAVTCDFAGTTRDRLFDTVTWNGREFLLVDTAGFGAGSVKKDELNYRITEQIETSIDQADLILLIVDAGTLLTNDDYQALKKIQMARKPYLVIANKADDIKKDLLSAEFYKLQTEKIFTVSALSGRGTGDLLDEIINALPKKLALKAKIKTPANTIRVSIIGRPNVGKSSLLNAFSGNSRSVVSDTPGTTRDTVDLETIHNGKKIVFVDTAGLRRRGKIGKTDSVFESGQVEKYSSFRAFQAIEGSDLALMVIDTQDGVTAQDLHIAGYAVEQFRGLIIVVNKWDLADEPKEEFLAILRKKISFLPYVPIVFVSAKNRSNIKELLRTIEETYNSQTRRIPTAELNHRLQADILRKSPPANKGVVPKLKYFSQTGINPPTFVFFTSKPDKIHFSYKRYLENRIRDNWNFSGTPLKIVFKDKGKDENNRRPR